MKRCKECGQLSPDRLSFCQNCGRRLPLESEPETKEFAKDTAKGPAAEERDGIRFDGLYRADFGTYVSCLRFFPDGRVVSVSSTGTAESVSRWLDYDYEDHGTWTTMEDGTLVFDSESPAGRVSFEGRPDPDGTLVLNTWSHINDHRETGRRYSFLVCPGVTGAIPGKKEIPEKETLPEKEAVPEKGEAPGKETSIWSRLFRKREKDPAPESEKGLLRFDGLYQAAFSSYFAYFRFYPDGMVVSVSSTGNTEDTARWLDRSHNNKGTYRLDGSSISFDTVSPMGRVRYWGRLGTDGSMTLDSESLINGHRETGKRYEFRYVRE